MENKMESYLGAEYSEDNHIMNWLIYWRQGEDTKNKSDTWRMENDLDCLYMHKIEADTIVSIYQILNRVVKSINPNIKLLPKNDLLVQQLQLLASKAELRQNFMVLPNRNMQNRGFRYADAMAPTLYQCFDNGVYSEYFDYDITKVKSWVDKEGLEILFENNEIDIHKVKPMIEGYLPTQSFKRTTDKEKLLKIIKYSIDFLDRREIKYEA